MYATGSQINEWRVKRVLQRGQFGQHLRVEKNGSGECFMKVQHGGLTSAMLLMEFDILHILKASGRVPWVHTLNQDRDPYYYVCKSVGKTLEDLRRMAPGRFFSIGTVTSCAVQSLEALKRLHDSRYLHCDVHPRHFTIGRELGDTRWIYMIGFKFSSKIPPGKKSNRSQSGFYRNYLYASAGMHTAPGEYGMKDDIESWAYMCLEFYDGTLPWKATRDPEQILIQKVEGRGNGQSEGVAEPFKKILNLLDNISRSSGLNHDLFMDMMRGWADANGGREYPLDWERFSFQATRILTNFPVPLRAYVRRQIDTFDLLPLGWRKLIHPSPDYYFCYCNFERDFAFFGQNEEFIIKWEDHFLNMDQFFWLDRTMFNARRGNAANSEVQNCDECWGVHFGFMA